MAPARGRPSRPPRPPSTPSSRAGRPSATTPAAGPSRNDADIIVVDPNPHNNNGNEAAEQQVDDPQPVAPEEPEPAPALPAIGDPHPGVKLNPNSSFVYQFNFFRKGKEPGTAICRICEEANKEGGMKKVQETFSCKDGCTSGNNY